MSESQNYDEVTVTSNAITVIKTFEADAFPVPAIAFRINSDRTEAVTVRLVDDVPENVAVEDLGFHPEYGSEYWTIEDDEITFEREVEAEEQYTTVYGIRATGTDNVEQFLTEPEIADVDPPLEDEDGVVGGNGSDVVRDVISGNADSVPGLEDDEAEDEDIGTLDLTDPNAEQVEATPDAVDLVDDGDDEGDDADAEADDGDAESDEEAEEPDEQAAQEPEAEVESDDDETADTEQATGGAVDIESVASALATEIEDGEVDDDDLEVLRSELEVESSGGSGGAVEARIEKLQTDVSELDAYVDALEEFLEENGTGQDLIQGLQDDVANLEDQLGGLEDDIDDNTQQVASLEDSVGGIQSDLQSLKGDVKDVDDDIDAIQGSIDDLEGDLDDIDEVDDRVDDIEENIEDLQEWREQLSNVLGAADGD